MENLRFEESFKEAFDGAEVAPSSAVWVNVELGLEKTSGGKMKGRLLFFQLLAAASMVFAMGIGGIYYLNTNQDVVQPIAEESTKTLKNQEQSNIEANTQPVADQPEVNTNNHVVENNNTRKAIFPLKDAGATDQTGSTVAVSGQPVHDETNHLASLISRSRTLPALVEIEKPAIRVATSNQPDPGMVLLAKLRDEEKKYQEEKPDLKEKVWASIGMGAGTYNPTAMSSSSSRMDKFNDATFAGTPISDPTAGTSYSIGVSLSGKVAKRIVLQAGISYLNQNSTYTSNTSLGSSAFMNEYASSITKEDVAGAHNQITMTNPYQLNNNLQYMSIPLQAGYILLDRDFAIQMNAGIATDIFFQNTLTPENSDLEEVKQGPGDDSPYRTLNFSGLLGTELSYKVGDHYRIAVNPGFRYALNSIYKSDVVAEASPVTFDVALRVRYLF